MFLVYKITNCTNGKIYIGLTGHSFKRRWQEHINSAISLNDDYVFHKALRKYGEKSFKKEIVCSNLTKAEAQAKERELIKKYDSYYLNGKGYNMTFGGECNDHKKGELNYGAKLTNKEAAKVRKLLKDHSLSFSQIAQKMGLDSSPSGCAIILRINNGTSYRDENETYPIRANSRAIGGVRRRGENNPSAKLTKDQVLEIINMLETSPESQTAISKKYGVTYNTINFINRCLTWTELHSYNKNIRLEYKQKGKN